MSINAWVDKGDEINAPVSNVFFGDGVAMDACGTVLVAFGIMGNGNTPAYGYKYDSGTGAWNNQSLTFAASGGGSSNGAAVSASGDVIFVGEEDYNSYEGRVSVFNDAGGGSWTSPGTVINNPTSTTNEYFGSGIALSRDISGGYPTVLAVGAKEQPWETTNNGGKIYVFQYGAGSYSNISGLTVDGSSGNPGDNLGDYPMQLNSAGTRMILGSDKDRVYVLERDNLADTTWSKVGPTLTAPTNSAYGYYDFGKGASIDGSGDIIAISDPKYGAASDSDGVTGPGQTLIFEYKVPSSAEWSSGDGNSGTDASFGYAGNVYKDGDTTQTTDKKYWVQKGQRIVGNIQTSGGQSGGDKEGKNVKLSRDGNYLLSVGDKALGGVNNYPIDSSGSGNYVTLNYNVDVAGGKFRLWEESQVNLTAFLGNTLVFYQNESTNSTHPLVIGTDTDSGTLSSGPDISYNNSGGSGTVTFTPQTARTYYYYCSNHSGMGSRIDILDNSGTNVTKYVTVYNNGGGNKYYFSDTEVGESDSLPEGELVPGFNVFLGKTLTLDQRHSSNGGNQIEISFTPNGAATEITNNVTYTGAAGNMSSTDPGKFVLNVTDDVYGSGGFYYYSASNNSVDGTPGSDYGNTYGSEVNVRFPIVGKGQTYKYNSSSNEWEYHGTPLWEIK